MAGAARISWPPWSWSPERPDTWAARLVERLLGEGRQRARARARPARLEPRAGVEAVAGDVLSGAGHRARRSRAAAAPTTWCTRWRRPPRAGRGRLRRPRPPRRRELRRRRARGGRGAGGLPGRHRPGRRAHVRPPRLAAGGRGDPAGRRARRHGAARLDRDRRPLRRPFGCWCGWSSACASCPMPRWRANRTQPIDERDVIEFLARTPAVAAAAGRSLDIVRTGRAHLRRDDRADRRSDGRGPAAHRPAASRSRPRPAPW